MGEDNLYDFTSWYKYTDILSFVNIIVLSRDNTQRYDKISTLKINNKLINLATGGTKGIQEPNRKIILEKFNSQFKRCFIGSAGVETLMLANNKVDFIFHGRVTPWDHSPLSLIIKEAGGEVLMFNDASTFNVFSNGPILAAKNIEHWNHVKVN